MGLRPNKNKIEYRIKGEEKKVLSCFIWLLDYSDKLIISDIDGTITKSDEIGQVMNFLKKDYSHENIVALYRKLEEAGYKIIYLTARPIYQAEHTRDYLCLVRQDNLALPDGPLITSPSNYLQSIKQEMVIKTAYILKTNILSSIGRLFAPFPFSAGFGNKDTDAIGYRMVGVPLEKVFIINKKSQVIQLSRPTRLTNYLSIANNFQDYFQLLS